MAGGQAVIIAGIGARARATGAEIVAAIGDACARAGFELSDVGVVAGWAKPETEAAMREAARTLRARAELVSTQHLQAEAGRCVTASGRSMAAAGVPSVAEAAAMAAAGPEGMLFLPRIASSNVTVALAVGPGEAGQ